MLRSSSLFSGRRSCAHLSSQLDLPLCTLAPSDEHTSGLDSVTALCLCTTLRELSRAHACTVLCTIHQPQAKIFSLFDTLILLQVGRTDPS